MNAGRDVERLIAAWLIEEAPGRAPDRILEEAARVIDRTRQRRFIAAWREPMPVSLRGLAAAGAIGVVLVGGAIFALRGAPSSSVGGGPSTTASPGPSPSPSPSEAPSPSAAVIACDLITREEAESLGGILGLGALPSASGSGDDTTCLYADGGGNVVLRINWLKVGGGAAFEAASAIEGIEPVTELSADVLYDPNARRLYVARDDALVIITSGTASDEPNIRRERALRLGELVIERM